MYKRQTVNILLAFVIYSFILMIWGEKKVYNSSLKYGIAVEDSLMMRLGFKDGDKIVTVNSDTIVNFYDVIPKMILAKDVTVERDGKSTRIDLPEDLIGQLVQKKRRDIPLLSIRYPFWVGNNADTGQASLLGLKRWDKIVMVDSVPTPYFNDVAKAFLKKKNDSVLVTFERAGQLLSLIHI